MGQAVDVRAGDRLGDGGKRLIAGAGQLEPVRQENNVDGAALVLADDGRAGGRQPRIGGNMGVDFDRRACWRRERHGLGRRPPHVGVVGQFRGATAGAFAQIPFRQRLEAPGDSSDEIRLVPGAGVFAKQLCVLLSQLAGRHLPQRGDFPVDVELHKKASWFEEWLLRGVGSLGNMPIAACLRFERRR